MTERKFFALVATMTVVSIGLMGTALFVAIHFLAKVW